MTEPAAPPVDARAFAARFLPMFEQAGAVSDQELEEFAGACYDEGMIVVFDWIEWRDQASVLLETSGAMERTSIQDLQQLLTSIVRQERFAEGTLRHAAEQGWLHAVLGRMSQL